MAGRRRKIKILFNDIIQYSKDTPKELKSPSLAEVYNANGTPFSIIHLIDEVKNYKLIEHREADEIIAMWRGFVINFDKSRPINSIGIGNADASGFSIAFNDSNNTIFDFTFSANGLYVMDRTVTASQMIITTNASYIGRLAAGLAVNIPTSIAKEPAFRSTAEPRLTLGGQIVAGAGGHIFKTVSLDSRYKIDKASMKEIEDGYFFTSMGYPFFIDLSDESYKLPFSKLYANERNQRAMSFESGVRRFLYSRRFEFLERF